MYKCVTLAFLLALGLSGCETLPWERQSAGQNPPVELLDEEELRSIDGIGTPPEREGDDLAAAPSRRFKDVPLPADLRLDLDQTFVYENAEIQVAHMVYYAKTSVTQLAQFYIDECPKEGWKLGSVMHAEGGATINFSKPGKTLEVLAQAQRVGRSQKLVVNLRPDAN